MHHEETFMIFLPFCQHHCTQLLFYTWKLLLEIRYRALSLHSDSLSRDHSPLLTYAFILTGSLTQREPSHLNVITCIHHFTPPSIDCSNSQVILTIFVTCVSSQSQKHKGGYSNRPVMRNMALAKSGPPDHILQKNMAPQANFGSKKWPALAKFGPPP